MVCIAARPPPNDHLALPSPSLGDAPAPPSFPQDEVIGGDQAGDDRFAQAGVGIYHHLVPRACYWVGGEENSCDLCCYHALDHNGELHRLLIDPLAVAVGDSAISPKRGPAAPDRVEEHLLVRDVQVGVLLTGEGGLWEVFGCRAR